MQAGVESKRPSGRRLFEFHLLWTYAHARPEVLGFVSYWMGSLVAAWN